MSKLDVKSAFRICPVRKSDWHLFGFSFQDLYFVNLCLPFGLCSSVNRFSQLVDAILWILQANYAIIHSTNYLDDYFMAGPANSNICQQDLNRAISVFSILGIPLAPEKIVSSRKIITYLGMIIDSGKMELRLPDYEITKLTDLIQSFKLRKKSPNVNYCP